MSQLEEVLQENVIHAVRSDGAKLLVMKVQDSTEPPIWEVLTIDKDGQIAKDGMMTLDVDQQAVYRKTFTTEQLRNVAKVGDYVEWQPGFLPRKGDEQQYTLEEQKDQFEGQIAEQQRQIEEQLADARTRLDAMITSAKRSITAKIGHLPRITPEEVEQQIKRTAAEIAQRSPSHTQKIIAYQVELSGGHYVQVAEQSRLSFRLSIWLVIVGAILFGATVVAVIVPFASGNTSLIGTLGTIASVLVESVAGFSFLYNRATRQLAEFQVYLDRINRASICHAMTDEFDKKSKEQQELITMIIQALMRDK